LRRSFSAKPETRAFQKRNGCERGSTESPNHGRRIESSTGNSTHQPSQGTGLAQSELLNRGWKGTPEAFSAGWRRASGHPDFEPLRYDITAAGRITGSDSARCGCFFLGFSMPYCRGSAEQSRSVEEDGIKCIWYQAVSLTTFTQMHRGGGLPSAPKPGHFWEMHDLLFQNQTISEM